MNTTQQAALLSIIKLLADASKDTIAAIKPGQQIMGRLLNYGNLVIDIEAFIPQLGNLSGLLSGLQPADYVTLAGALVTDLALTDAKAQAIVQASLALLAEVAGPVLSKTEALFAAIKAPDTAAAAAPSA
jgi:hypothetical protein